MPSTFRYSRSILIDAPADLITPEIADLRRHVLWSPFSKPDPKVKDAYSGDPGEGQSRTWEGGRSGAGRISVDAVEPGMIRMTLAMRKPVKAVNQVEFALTPEAGGTRVSWTLSGPMNWYGRILGLFVDCEAMCGRSFEEGLSTLKAAVESRERRPSAA